jgi:type VI secretion system protein ImpG
MDPRLLQYYNIELQHLREMGAEFAKEHPKIAAGLGMSGIEVADPYVERLIEGFGFLAARVHLKLDAEFPRFTQSLLETVYPHYLAPTPSMAVAQFTPNFKEPGLVNGVTVPRGSSLLGVMGRDDATQCEFRTSQDVTLWPIEIESASYFSYAPDLPLTALPVPQRDIKGGVRIALKTAPGSKFSQLSLDRLSVYVTGHADVANRLYELCITRPLGVLVLPGKGANRKHQFLGPSSVHAIGFADDEAVLPVTLRSFQGYRLLQEYFAFPQRFRFLEIAGLHDALERIDGSELELVLLLGRGEASFESVVNASNLALFATPAVNLFPRRADRIHVDDSTFEYHVVPDRTRPLDFEVYEVTSVVGYGVGSDSEQEFRPFYSAFSSDGDSEHTAFFTTRREPRLVTAEQRERGLRSSYIGSEVFLGLVDSAHAPFSGDLRQLSIQTLCTNRDVILHMPAGIGPTDFELDVSAPVTAIRVIAGPSRPYAPLADGNASWKAISHLSLNYLSLVNSTTQEGAAALRDLLELYAGSGDIAARKQVDSVHSVSVRPVVRRLPAMARGTDAKSAARASGSRLSFGRGLEITVEVDERAFEGGSAFLLGSVLAQFFSRYVSINSFTETVLRSIGRGEIYRWVPQWGARPTL